MQNPDKDYRLSIIGYRKNRKPKTENRTGFSFMELMVVVAIVAILIVASMPLFRSFARGSNIKNGAVMVVSALKKTREAAITYRKNYKTVLDTVNQAVAIYYSDDTLAENWQKLPEFVGFDTSLPWNVDVLSGNIYKVEFKPNGALGSGAAAKNILIKEESTGDTRVIEANGLTGRIRIE